MEYLLTVLANGRTTYLERTLDAFFKFVTPRPAAVYLYNDGGQGGAGQVLQDAFQRHAAGIHENLPATVEEPSYHLGMCRAHANCWDAAARAGIEWAFHLEEDMVILRPTSLGDLADVLSAQQHVKQMALVRCPWGFEVEHGGYIAQSPGWYERTTSPAAGYGYEYIETTRNWAAAPALFRTALAREFSWPVEDGCETAIGPQIIERYPEAKFGLWGWGEPWCAHIGVERAPGARGY